MTLSEIHDLIMSTNGKIFSVKFQKRNSTEIREMLCRLGVKKGLADRPQRKATDFEANKLICVWDMQKKAYRAIPLEGILEVKIADVKINTKRNRHTENSATTQENNKQESNTTDGDNNTLVE